MKKLLASVVLGLVFSVVPMSIYAACADIITVGEGRSKQVCFLVNEYVINGVQFCEYSCS